MDFLRTSSGDGYEVPLPVCLSAALSLPFCLCLTAIDINVPRVRKCRNGEGGSQSVIGLLRFVDNFYAVCL